MINETVLATLDGSHVHERLQVILVHTPEGSSVLLRQQNWGESIGWPTKTSCCQHVTRASLHVHSSYCTHARTHCDRDGW